MSVKPESKFRKVELQILRKLSQMHVCVFSGHVGPTGEQKASRQDDLLNLFRPILAGGGKGYPKNQHNGNQEKLNFVMRGGFLKNGGVNGWAFTVVVSTSVIQMVYKTYHKEKQTK